MKRILVSLTVSACLVGCGGRFSSSTYNSSSNSGTQNALLPAADLTSLGIAVTHLLGAALSNFPNLAEVVSCQSLGPCTGNGPSREVLTTNCSAGGVVVSGTTAFTHSGAMCSPLNSNRVTVAPDLNYSSSGQVLHVSSESLSDYVGANSGGGVQIGFDLLDASASIAILGLHFTGAGHHSMDISSRSVSPLVVSADFTNLKLQASGGQLELRDNFSHYTAVFSVSGIKFDTTCTCPTSGTATGTLTGAASGPATITFNATCGNVTVNALGRTLEVPVLGCTSL